MDREQEHIALKQELKSTPATLDDVFLKAQTRMRKRSIRKAIITPLGLCAAVFILFVGLVNFSPVIAAAVEQIPGLHRLAEFVSISPSLIEKVEQGHVQTVGLEQRVGDSTLRVEYIIKDGQKLHIFMSLDPPEYDYMSFSVAASEATSVSIMFRRDQHAIEFYDLVQVTLGFDSAIPPVVHLSGDLLDFRHNTDGNFSGRSIGRYSFAINTG